MKSFKINLMDLIALILLVFSFFIPFLANSLKVNGEVLLMLINCYLIGYLSYLISFMETKKVLLMAIPLILFSGFLIFFMRDFKFVFEKQRLHDLLYVITNLYDVIFVVICFFVIEIVLSRIVGGKASLGFGVAALILYYVMQNSDIIPFDFYYKDLLVYFFFFVMAARIKPAVKFNNFLLFLGLLFLAGEIYLYIYLNYYPGFYLSTIILTYLILKQSLDVECVNRQRYLFFAYLYPYKVIYVLLKSAINASPFAITIIAVLSTFIIGEFLYKIKVKFLDYLFIGIH
ncbi:MULTISPECIES: hypothetical protein [Anaerococcus]|uniref:Acyltransferase 3 domain-containing protein n=1 Tax=Anaerococcus octavius TaxID=54007 RepID=A0A2I1MBK3_9FIRM|nr:MULTISPECIES: hypothetical protein [Anaerococcus]MBS6105263.1 hypothetical protein [Anaerococcus sp.]PKZ17515.1 hypothetical protein CYJ34_02040 [Anaerococcus octavius]